MIWTYEAGGGGSGTGGFGGSGGGFGGSGGGFGGNGVPIIDNLETYVIEIYEGNALIQTNVMQTFPLMAQDEFMRLCVRLKQIGKPMKVRFIKQVEIEGRKEPLQCYLEYQTWSDD